MREIIVEKVTLNAGIGKPGPELDKAMKLLHTLTKSKPIQTKAKRRIPGWGLRPGLPIGCKVTLRKKRSTEILKQLLQALNNRLDESKFDENGNFAFGIAEYLDIPGVEYNAEVGIIGLEVAVTLSRKGYRIKRRKLRKRKIPHKHAITKDDAIKFMKEKFNVKIGS